MNLEDHHGGGDFTLPCGIATLARKENITFVVINGLKVVLYKHEDKCMDTLEHSLSKLTHKSELGKVLRDLGINYAFKGPAS